MPFPRPRSSRSRLLPGVAAIAVAALLAGCSAAPGTPSAAPGTRAASQPSGPLATAPSGTSAPSASDSGSPQDEPSESEAPSVAPTNEDAPPSASARPDSPASADPAALQPTGPRTTPNLGSASKLQPTTTLGQLPASPKLGKGFSGAKVYLIQQKFGIDETIQTMDAATRSAVRSFQSREGLPATGVVDQKTWKAMFPDVPWTIDRYRVSPSLPADASANERIEAMISYARAQKGAPYVWGSAGPKKYGYDCSGLLLQALYYAGLDPEPINVVDHQGLQKTAKELYEYPGFTKVPVEERKRGDFVFYGPPDGRITHVVLYLDDGYVLEALPPRGTSEDKFYESWFNHGQRYSMKPYAVRVTS